MKLKLTTKSLTYYLLSSVIKLKGIKKDNILPQNSPKTEHLSNNLSPFQPF